MKILTSALFLGATLVTASCLDAQDATSGPDTLLEEMTELNVTMQKIATLLERYLEGQATDLLIKRVDLTNRTLLSKQEELRKARADVIDLTEEEGPLRINLETWQESMSRGEVEEEDRKMLELQMVQMENRLKSVQSRRQDLERRIVELENAVMSHEQDMRILEDVLDEKLGLR